jgi:hypothetical protein
VRAAGGGRCGAPSPRHLDAALLDDVDERPQLGREEVDHVAFLGEQPPQAGRLERGAPLHRVGGRQRALTEPAQRRKNAARSRP